MAPISINAYDADVRIPGFSGIFQRGDGLNADPGTAQHAVNMVTPGGVLQPAGACVLLDPSLPQPVETLAYLHRRWYSGDDDRDILIAATGGLLYACPLEARRGRPWPCLKAWRHSPVTCGAGWPTKSTLRAAMRLWMC